MTLKVVPDTAVLTVSVTIQGADRHVVWPTSLAAAKIEWKLVQRFADVRGFPSTFVSPLGLQLKRLLTAFAGIRIDHAACCITGSVTSKG